MEAGEEQKILAEDRKLNRLKNKDKILKNCDFSDD